MSNKFGEVNFSVPPSERHGLTSKTEIASNMEIRLPEFPRLLSETIEEIHILHRRFFTETTNQSAGIVGNHAFNDLDSFIDCLLSGDGRAAARASRSLFEHLVNYCEVMSSTNAAERYLEHAAVTADLLGNLTHGLRYLRGTQHKQERTRLNKLKRDALPRLKNSLSLFGSRFRRDWSSRNLHDRAAAHGYGSHYDTYRLLSQVTHGSSGGVLGSHAAIAGKTVHRTGFSLELAVLSYLEGFTFFREFAKEVNARQSIDTSRLVRWLDILLAYWPKYRHALMEIDTLIWPVAPPPSPVAIMALYPNGRIRWFFWEPALRRMKPAHPPEEHEWQEERFREYARSGEIKIPPNMNGRPITSAVHGVQVAPKEGAAWFPEDGFFAPGLKPSVPWLSSA
ncbi:DUF5677 domain-containing protein [Streptomyces europaeiscabiei]|uniref:DUF5677 domain-containing protein n=1 Tax=Streptomyces TaxID=1883 RepID=UPI001B3034B5|nr:MULTISPECIES: DUF5677 domain-containing protein [Streptomyces]MBP5869244.1 hypothetical protein [Streptomyces sp. LBUM 1485]MBP5914824.1 hypothetical protein [Streptomyces sp. LBUM 1486]MDX3031097.1 DUF5677 domain-containing protein [Streptomyces scabiei]QTU55761.1 hypothetical protein F3K21_25570 [Streptomyces sp. LBUM 1480]